LSGSVSSIYDEVVRAAKRRNGQAEPVDASSPTLSYLASLRLQLGHAWDTRVGQVYQNIDAVKNNANNSVNNVKHTVTANIDYFYQSSLSTYQQILASIPIKAGEVDKKEEEKSLKEFLKGLKEKLGKT
jgi:hypothetical protein